MTTETAMEVENKENGTDKITSDMEGMEVGENGHNGIEETPEDDDSKYTDEDKPRRVVVKNIDFKANAEEIEEFFGSETFQNIEHVSRKFTARGTWKEKKEGKPLKKRFNGVVIVTFEDKDAAEKFIAMEDLTFKERKLRKHSLTESEERREKFLEQKKAKIEANKKKKEDEKKAAQLKKKKDEEAAQKKKTEESVKKNAKSTNPGDCIVVCRGFHMNADSLQEVMKYFYDNHEHVIDVNMEVLRDNFGYQRWDDKAFVTFMNKGAADRFISLAYVRFKGNKITRCSVSDYKDIQAGKGKKAGAGAAPGNKRKLPEDEKKPVELEKGAAIMIKGIENKHTKIKDIRDKLKAVDVKLQDIVYVGYENGEGEAQVRLKGASSDGVAELIKKLNNSNILMGDEISVSKLTGKAEKELAEKAKEHLNTMPSKKEKKLKNEAKKQRNLLENY
jgi:hypothetical protein